MFYLNFAAMKPLFAFLSYFWKIYFLVVVILVVLIFYPIQAILLTNEMHFPKGFRLIRFQAKLILFLIGVRTEVIGDIPNDKTTSYIICPNHSSYLDILMLYSELPNYFIFLGKKELGSVPVFNVYFKRMNILVDRGNPKAAHAAITTAIGEIKKGTNLVIFPEGTIPDSTPIMKPFKNGAFKAAIQCKIPIIPITFKDNYKLLEDDWGLYAKKRPGKSRMYIHAPIKPKNSETDLVTLREETYEAIASKLD